MPSPDHSGRFCPPDESGALSAFSFVACYSESLWKYGWNTDEKKVQRFQLPPLSPASQEVWENEERPRLLRTFKDIMYGEMPPGPDSLQFEVLNEKPDALDGLAIRREYRIHCRMQNGRKHFFDMLLYVPKQRKPAPVFVGLNFRGNQYSSPENDVLLTGSLQQNAELKMIPFTEKDRGLMLETWNFTEAMKRGYAVATAAYGEICPDHLNGLKKSVFSLFYDEKDLRSDYEVPFDEIKKGWTRKTSLLGAWAWGLSRMLDILELEPLVDAKKAVAIGHSRNAKAAIWAGACDPRFAVVISNNSGCAGAALSRRNFGETLKLIYWEKRAWLCGKIVDYLEQVDQLPIDQHQLLALIAPRSLYVASAADDLNADPKGEFLAASAASPVWKLYHLQGLADKERMPAVNQPAGASVRYHIRTGKHAITEWDWQQYYDFADDAFKG